MIYIVRHSIDDDTKKGGWSSAPLTQEGVALARSVGQQLKAYPIQKIVCSDLLRAKQTCEIMNEYLRVPVEYTNALREYNVGVASGMTYEDVERLYPTTSADFLDKNFKYPEGETLREFETRIIDYYNWEMKDRENVLFITHRNVINVLYHYLKGLNWQYALSPITIQHCSLFSIENECIKKLN